MSSPSSLFLGIDIGTSSVKAVLIDATGRVRHTAAAACGFVTPQPLWAEADPADWWTATVNALRELTAQAPATAIAGIGLTGQMHGLVLLDQAGAVLRPCIMWNDQRTAAQCAELTGRVGAAQVLALTGNPVLPGFTAPKILWVQQHEPDVWARAAHILLPKDFIRQRLSGALCSDVADASGTSLLDVGQRCWAPEMLAACGVTAAQLPELAESTAVTARVSAAAAAATGLVAGTPIVAGAGDQAAGAVGCGIVRPGLLSCTLGTSGVLYAHAERFQPDPRGRLHAFCAAVPGAWHLMGVQLSCAGSYQWLHGVLGGGRSFAELDALAAAVPRGAEELYFLPYLSGERTPHADPYARGVFSGLTLRHGPGHLARAVLEGVSFGLRDALVIMRELGIAPEQIVVSGGGAKSPLWRSILAEVFASRIVTVNASEGAAYGAAVLAAVGGGAHADVVAACDAMLAVTGETAPDPAGIAAYDRHYPHFSRLYPALAPLWRQGLRA